MADLSSLLAAVTLIVRAQDGEEAANLQIVEQLKPDGGINVADAKGKTSLHRAASLGLEYVCKEFLKRGAAVDSVDLEGLTPLHAAAMAGQSGTCRLLIEEGATIDMCDVRGMTPLFRAALWAVGNEDLFRSIPFKLLQTSIASIIEACRVLMELGAQTGTVSRLGTALHLIAGGWGFEACGDKFDGTSEQVCHMLLDGGALVNQPDERGRTALFSAIVGENVKACRWLLARGADVNLEDADGETPLLLAANLGYAEIVKLLLENGVEANHVNDQGLSALHGAALGGHEDVCTLLLDAKVDTEWGSKKRGLVALHVAAAEGYTGVCKLFLERGAAVEITTTDGWTALGLAASSGHSSTCSLLLEKGAAVNGACCLNGTDCAPVWLGVYGKGEGNVSAESLELIKVLMDHGVDYKPIFDYASERNDRVLIETIVLHTSSDPSIVPNGVLLRDLTRDLAEWRAMPNNLQDALVKFADNMADVHRLIGKRAEPESGKNHRRSRKRKKRKL